MKRAKRSAPGSAAIGDGGDDESDFDFGSVVDEAGGTTRSESQAQSRSLGGAEEEEEEKAGDDGEGEKEDNSLEDCTEGGGATADAGGSSQPTKRQKVDVSISTIQIR